MTGKLDALEGERDQNHRLTQADGRRFVLKLSGATEDPAVVDFQVKALQHLERAAPDIPAPRVVPTLAGETAAEITGDEGARHKLRLLTYLPGIPHSEGTDPSPEGLAAIGAFGGALAKALADFDHPASRHFTPWDMDNGLLGSRLLWRHGDADIAAFEKELRPRFAELFTVRLKDARRQVAHFDLHQDNLLRPDARDESVIGVIDFGDMVRGPLVCDPAIIAASFSSQSDPLESMAAAVAGYHRVCPLTEAEISLLYDLVLARLVQTVLLDDFRLKETADPPAFLTEMRPRIMESLRRVSDLDRDEVTQTFLSACRHCDQ